MTLLWLASLTALSRLHLAFVLILFFARFARRPFFWLATLALVLTCLSPHVYRPIVSINAREIIRRIDKNFGVRDDEPLNDH